MSYKSAYGQAFGRAVDLTDMGDISILKYKKFSELPCTSMLNEKTKNHIDTWNSLKDEEYYVKAVLSCLRSMLTSIRNQEPTKSTIRDNHYLYCTHEQIKPDRIDLMSKTIRSQVALKYSQSAKNLKQVVSSPSSKPSPPLQVLSPKIANDRLRMFYKGSGNCTTYCEPPNRLQSLYLAQFKGVPHEFDKVDYSRHKNDELIYTSFAFNSIPDPQSQMMRSLSEHRLNKGAPPGLLSKSNAFASRLGVL